MIMYEASFFDRYMPAQEPAQEPIELVEERPQTMIERHPEWNANLLFWFGCHGNSADMQDVAPLIRKADVYYYETSNPEITEILQKMSDGAMLYDITLSSGTRFSTNDVNIYLPQIMIGAERLEGSPMEPIFRGANFSNTVIRSLDTDHDIIQKITNTDLYPKEEDFERKLKNAVDRTRTRLDLQNEREKAILNRFEEDFSDVMRTARFAGKSTLNVLISMGSYHTTLRHLFAEQGIASKQQFSTKPYVYDHSTELQRKMAFNEAIDRQSVVRAVATNFVWKSLDMSLGEERKSAPSDLAYLRYPRHVVSHLSEEQVRRMNTQDAQSGLTVDYTDGILAEVGLDRLPRSTKELQEQIAKTPMAKVAARAAKLSLKQAA